MSINWDFLSTWVVNPGTYPTFASIDDGNGITTADENVGPNPGDANGYGTLFNVQVGAEPTSAGQPTSPTITPEAS